MAWASGLSKSGGVASHSQIANVTFEYVIWVEGRDQEETLIPSVDRCKAPKYSPRLRRLRPRAAARGTRSHSPGGISCGSSVNKCRRGRPRPSNVPRKPANDECAVGPVILMDCKLP